MTKVKAAIVGGTGYGGMELLRWLLDHPSIEVTAITSRSETGAVGDAHPHLRGLVDLKFTADRAVDLAKRNDLLFFATPAGVAAKEVPAVLQASDRVKVVDLSGDFRLHDAGAYPAAYGWPHPAPDVLARAAYGLPECGGRAAAQAPGCRLVANPGCHASAAILALWPIAKVRRAPSLSTVVSVTGSSGSGAQPKQGTHHPERFANFRAYKPLDHQHVPEIEQALAAKGAKPPRVAFVPCSAPFSRGISVTAVLDLGVRAEGPPPRFARRTGRSPSCGSSPRPPRSARSRAATSPTSASRRGTASRASPSRSTTSARGWRAPPCRTRTSSSGSKRPRAFAAPEPACDA